jgi:hypothetical protein
MPEASQYIFPHKELLELLIKKAGVHEGKWTLNFNLSFAVANVGPGPEQIVPAGIVGIQSVGIQKALPEAPEALVLDAAVVNPVSTSKRRPS